MGRLLETAEQRGRTLGKIAAAMVKVGQAKQAAETLTEALATLRKDNDTEEKAANLAMIAATQAKAGLIEQAHQTFAEAIASAGNVKYPDFSDDGNSAPTKVASTQRSAGFLSDALASARAIKYPGEKASALIEIAGEQIDGGHADQAAQPLVPQITFVSPPKPKFHQILGDLPIFPSRSPGVSRWRLLRGAQCRSSGRV